MTFNIRNGLADDGMNSWEHRRHLTAKVIRESNADIIGLQEVYEFQLEYLKSELPEYAFYSVGREDGDTLGEQCSILWRADIFHLFDMGTFWLSDTPDIPNSMSWGNRITRTCSWVEFADGFRFYNTHWDHESANARRESAVLLLSMLPSTPWVLVGDFNAEPDSSELSALAPCEAAWFCPKGSRIGTFHNFNGGDDGELIDHLFVSRELKAMIIHVDQTVEGDIYPSDHYPVIFEVDLSDICPIE